MTWYLIVIWTTFWGIILSLTIVEGWEYKLIGVIGFLIWGFGSLFLTDKDKDEF
jgi:hypothetical protein